MRTEGGGTLSRRRMVSERGYSSSSTGLGKGGSGAGPMIGDALGEALLLLPRRPPYVTENHAKTVHPTSATSQGKEETACSIQAVSAERTLRVSAKGEPPPKAASPFTKLMT